MFEFKNVSKKYKSLDGEKLVFESFNFTINDGDFISVIGTNGAGKSTLVRLLVGDELIDSGELLLDGYDIKNQASYIRKKKIAKVYQDPSKGTAGEMTILENMSLADNKGSKFRLSFAVSKRNIQRYKDILSQLNLGLENALHTKVKELSGGQRQSLALIMATMNKPDLLLLDEHTSALDPKTSDIIMQKTKDIVEKYKIPTLMITHNLASATKYAKRLVKLDNGKVVIDMDIQDKSSLDNIKLF
ncbi:MAG: ATP-binding cassette domain-containing protein [Acidaminobacteraceae bacterium]